MYRTTLISGLALALASRAAAQGISSDDIAPNCATVCSNIVTVSDSCERQFDDVQNEDQQELDCICNSQGLDAQVPECEACQRQYYSQDDDYDEIQTLLSRCGFSSMSATGTMTSMGSAPTGAGGATTIITSTYTDPDDDDDDNDIDLETTTITSVLPTDAAASTTGGGGAAGSGVSSATGGAGSAANSATDAAGSIGSSGTEAVGSATDAAGSVVEQSGNFAPAITAAPVLAAAGIAAAVFGF